MKEIRYARPEDVEEIIELQKLIHKELHLTDKFDDDWVYKSINQMMVEPNYIIVGTVDNKVVGCIGILVSYSLLNPDDFTGKEVGWSVTNEYKKELGEELLSAAIEVAKDKGINYIIGATPKTKPQLSYVYKKYGGEEIETLYKIKV